MLGRYWAPARRAELALLDELHGRDGGDCLGHRGDAEDGVKRHRRAAIEDARAERAFVEQALVGRRHRHDAGYILGLDRLAERAVDARPRERGALLRCRRRNLVVVLMPTEAAVARAAVPFLSRRLSSVDVMACSSL